MAGPNGVFGPIEEILLLKKHFVEILLPALQNQSGAKFFFGIGLGDIGDFFIVHRHAALLDVSSCVRTSAAQSGFDKERHDINAAVV